MSQPIRGQGGHLVFSIGPKNTNFVEDIGIFLPVKFCWILLGGFRGEVENVSANQRPGRPSCFFDRPKKHKLCRGRWDLASCQVSSNSVKRFQKRSRKCLHQSEARAAILSSDRPEKHKLGRGRRDLVSCQVLSNSVKRFQRRSRKCLSQSEARAAILFSDRPEKHKFCIGCWDLASCQVWLNSVKLFQMRSWKCEKLTTTDGRKDGRWMTDYGQCMITIVHWSLRLRCTKTETSTKMYTPF